MWRDMGFPLRFGLLSELSAPGIGDSWQDAFPAEATPTHGSTNLSAAIRSFQLESNDEPNAYLLIFSDGQWNRGPSPLEEASGLNAIQPGMETTPQRRIYSFGIGPAISWFDIALDRIDAPARIRAGEPGVLDISISISGGAPEEPIALTTRIVDEFDNEIERIDTSIDWAEGALSQTIEIPMPELPVGAYRAEAVIEPLNAEQAIENNRSYTRFSIDESRDRVLMLTSAPSWDYKFFKRSLEANDTIAVDAFLYRDGQLIRSGDRAWVNDQTDNEAPSSLEDLLNQAGPWSAVALHHLKWDASSAPLAEWIADYVENGGGALFFPGQINTEPAPPEIAERLPATMAGEYQYLPIQVLLEPESIQSLELKGVFETVQAQSLPPVGPLWKPASEQLAAQPILKGSGAGGAAEPLIQRHRIGLGQVLTVQGEGFWRLAMMTSDNPLPRFWLAVLVEASPRIFSGEGRISTDRFRYSLYDAVSVSYQPSDMLGPLDDGRFVNIQTPLKRESLWLSPSESAANALRAQYTVIEPGDYAVYDPVAGVTAEFIVESGAAESSDLSQNVNDLRTLAQESGGDYANQPAWDQLARRIPADTRIIEEDRTFFIGEKWWVAALLILGLGIEWFIRWRNGLP